MKAGARDRDGASFSGKERWMVGRFDPARSGGLRCGQSQKSSMPCGVAVSSSGKTLKMRIAQKKGAPGRPERPDKPDLSDVAFQGLRDLVLRHSADDLLDYLTILEHQQRRNTANIESAR